MEATFFLVSRRRGFNESYDPVFTKRVEITVGKHERSLAYAGRSRQATSPVSKRMAVNMPLEKP